MDFMTQPIIVLAGAAGDLGTRIAKALIARGAIVRALVRPDVSAADRARLTALGLILETADPTDVTSLAAAMTGAACVVSALNGLYEVIVGRQSVLLNAAVKAGVPRFIPSDYSEDFTKTRLGDNRNLDLRREFMDLADRAPIKVTSILNGAFMDMLGNEMPIIQPKINRVLYWINADQPLDFTTKDDVAAYTAAAALDEDTPRFLRISGETLTARDIANVLSDVTQTRYSTLWVGSMGMLSFMIGMAKRFAPEPNVTFPAWQGMQYMRDMFSGHGKLTPLDNGRYPELRWTSVRDQMTKQRHTEASTLTA
jgi:nucleoside-diphosphate-sugar epimerase